MKKQWWIKAGIIISVIVAAMFLTMLFLAVMNFSADDAQGYHWLYQRYELGERPEGSSLFNPMLALLSVLYFLGIGADGAQICMAYYAILYFGCIVITLLLALQEAKTNRWWLLLMAVFIFLPGIEANRYHLVPTFATLLTIYLIALYQNTQNRLFCLLAITVIIYTLITVNDRALFLMSICAPIIIWAIIWCLQNKSRHKYLYFASLLCAVTMMLGIILDFVLKSVRGSGLAIFGEWDGYGGSDYAVWIDVETLWNRAIPSFFSALMSQYNIPLNGGFIQALSFFWVIRILIVGLSLAVCVLYLKDIVKQGIENLDIVESMSSIIICVLTLANLLNGESKWHSGVDGWSINRYNSVAWFLLIVILVRWINKKYVGVEWNKILKRKITSESVLTIIFACLVIGYATTTQKNDLGKEPCRAEVEFLDSADNSYQYGVASYWKSFPITAKTSGKHIVCPGWIVEDEVDHSIQYLQCNSDTGNWSDGSNFFNYIISDLGNTMTIDDQNIMSIRGDYIDKNIVGNSEIYLYDYDIRWTPRLIMEAVGSDYELTEDIEYYFDFPIGTNRIEMDVTNSGNFNLKINDNADVENVVITNVNNNKIYVDLVCRQNTNVTLKVARKENEQTTIHKIVLKRVKGAIEVSGNEIELKEGSYIVTFKGENLDHAHVMFEGENITVKRLTDGRIKNRYQIDIAVSQTIKYNITGNDIVVDKVFYEDIDLLDENSIDKNKKYLWNI